MVSIHIVPIAVILIISIVCFIFRFKREILYLLPVPHSEAFALPISVERATQKPHADMYITNCYINSCNDT